MYSVSLRFSVYSLFDSVDALLKLLVSSGIMQTRSVSAVTTVFPGYFLSSVKTLFERFFVIKWSLSLVKVILRHESLIGDCSLQD